MHVGRRVNGDVCRIRQQARQTGRAAGDAKARRERHDEGWKAGANCDDPIEKPDACAAKEHNGDHQPERHVKDCGANREEDSRRANDGADREVELPGYHENANGYRDNAEFRGGVEPARGSVNRDETRALCGHGEKKVDEHGRDDSAEFRASGHPFQRPSTASGRVVNCLGR